MCACVFLCANFQAKQIALTFSDHISPKMELGLEIQKTNVEIRITILEILCQFSGKTNNFDFFFLQYYKLTKHKYNIRFIVPQIARV